jgi:hypothetical protein
MGDDGVVATTWTPPSLVDAPKLTRAGMIVSLSRYSGSFMSRSNALYRGSESRFFKQERVVE